MTAGGLHLGDQSLSDWWRVSGRPDLRYDPPGDS